MNVRPITHEDAPVVAALARADEEALRGRPSHVAADAVAAWWGRTDLANDSGLYEENGDVVAAGWFHVWGDIGSHVGIVAQGAKGRGLGASLVDRAEATAEQRGVPRVHAFALGDDPAAADLFRARGYREVRRFWEMAIDLGAEPAVPLLPEPLVLDEFRDGDERAFHHATVESFQDHWEWHGPLFEEWWEMRRDNDHTLWFVVRDGDEIAAVARNEAREASGYVGLLGVRRPWRGRGLAKALLFRTFAEFWRRNLPRVTLEVDAASPTGATKLYERVGMHVEAENVVFEKGAA
ncbi:MAG TPA: GNAT family N-acetyltransferase [Polyangiaceae bacterium]